MIRDGNALGLQQGERDGDQYRPDDQADARRKEPPGCGTAFRRLEASLLPADDTSVHIK
jgi:hypothetical protein